VIVLLFVGFPVAFAALSTALHIPLSLLLVGIVLRGSAFVFRAYDDRGAALQRRWGRVFAVSSTAAPVFLGVSVGAVASGSLRVVDGRVQTDFFSAWLAPFPWAVGLFTLALFAWLAAVYLAAETDGVLREDFRTRGLAAWAVAGGLSFVTLGLSFSGAPALWALLAAHPGAVWIQVGVGLLALVAAGALWARRWAAARWLAAAQVATVVLGWGLSQLPYVVPPDLTFAAAAAPDSVIGPVLVVLAVGAVALVPSYAWLMRVFTRVAPRP
jgi:cytochrome d ubiquinol oxidase subunit II